MKYFNVQFSCKNNWANETWLKEKIEEVFLTDGRGYGSGFDIVQVKELKTRQVRAVPIVKVRSRRSKIPLCTECEEPMIKLTNIGWVCRNKKCDYFGVETDE